MSCTEPLSAPKASCNIYIMYYNTSTNNISCKYDIPYYEERFILSYSIASNLLLGKLQKIRPYRQGDRFQFQDVVVARVRLIVGIENIYPHMVVEQSRRLLKQKGQAAEIISGLVPRWKNFAEWLRGNLCIPDREHVDSLIWL